MDLHRNGTLSSSSSRTTTSTTTTLSVPKPSGLKKPHSLYPMVYGRHMRDMEQWEQMYFRRATGRYTWSRSEDIPHNAVMLDIGCGYGTWAIMTARENTDCRIFGFDSAEIQPDLHRLGLHDLADRITWVHGDMLQALPFPNNHFDLVRACCVELCIPENKWGDLFQEIDRVLKPGGAFESAQGSLIIPCPRFAPRVAQPKSSKKSVDVLADDIDLRDHSKIKAAFEAMLEVRFLNPNLFTMIPFYMNLHFTNVMMTPILRIMLPPSTFIRAQDEAPDGQAAEPEAMTVHFDNNFPFTLQSGQQAVSSEIVIAQGGQMHLVHTMYTVLACREAIWEQFEVLNPELSRTDFDSLMTNWELDMRDRIDMRGTLNAGFGWSIPTDADREDGRRKAWRESMTQLYASEGPWDAQPLPEACRSIRAFTAIKPKK